MIQIDTIKELPQDVLDSLSDFARNELDTAGPYGPKLVGLSERVLVVRFEGEPLFVIGVVRKSLCGSVPEIWMLACQRLICDLWLVRKLKPLMFLLHKGPIVQTKIEETNTTSRRFAEFFGFSAKTAVDGIITYEVQL